MPLKCNEQVEAPLLETYLPCVYGYGHLSQHRFSQAEHDEALGTLVKRYRKALQRIASENDDSAVCGCDSLHACRCALLARDVLA